MERRHRLSGSQRRVLRLLWVIGAIVVAIFSLLPPSSDPIRLLAGLPVSDKVLHFAAYMFLAFLPAIHERLRPAALLLVATIWLGIGLEFAQERVHRSYEVGDMIADGWGALTGLLAGIGLRTFFISDHKVHTMESAGPNSGVRSDLGSERIPPRP